MSKPKIAWKRPRPAAACERAHIDADLLRDARIKAFLLVLATDGLMMPGGEYIYESFSATEALSVLVHEISEALADLGKQAAGEPERSLEHSRGDGRTRGVGGCALDDSLWAR